MCPLKQCSNLPHVQTRNISFCELLQRSSHPRHRYFRDESRREVDVTEMTLKQTTVVEAGEGGALSVDTHNLKPILTEVRVVKMVNEAP